MLETRAKKIGSDGETPFDQRLADALVSLCRCVIWGRGLVCRTSGGGPRALSSSWLDPDSALVGELERDGLISATWPGAWSVTQR